MHLIPQNVSNELELQFKNILGTNDHIYLQDMEPNEFGADQLQIVDHNFGLIKSALKWMEDNRKEIVKPLNNDVTSINNWFKDKADVLRSFAYKLESAIIIYKTKEKKLIEEANKQKLEAEIARKQAEIDAKKAELEVEKAGEQSVSFTHIPSEITQRCKEVLNMQQPAPIVVPEIPVVPEQTDTRSKLSYTYEYEVIDIGIFAQHCQEAGMMSLLKISESLTKKYVENMHKLGKVVPGLKITKKEVLKHKTRSI